MKYTLQVCNGCGIESNYLLEIPSPFQQLIPCDTALENFDLCKDCFVEWEAVTFDFFKKKERKPIEKTYTGKFERQSVKDLYIEMNRLAVKLNKYEKEV